MKSLIRKVLVCVLIISLFTANASALLRFTHLDSIKAVLNIASSTASCESNVKGKSGTDKITATITLYRINSNGSLTTEKTWSNISVGQVNSNSIISISEFCAASP